MHPSITRVLARLSQHIGEILSPQAIREPCRQAGYSWRDGKLDPVATISLFLLQILNGNTACQHVVHYGRWAITATAFCKAAQEIAPGRPPILGGVGRRQVPLRDCRERQLAGSLRVDD